MIRFAPEHRVLITGASSGIGRAVALRLNALGATVIANSRSREKLEAVRASAQAPERFFIEPLDLTADQDALPQWVRSLRERHGKLGGLVPCAGLNIVSPLREFDRTVAASFFDIHYHVPMLLAKGFADRRNNIGHGAAMVFIGSGATVALEPGLSIYGAAKSAVTTAAGVLSRELAPLGIRVNVLAPALVATPMCEDYLSFLPQERRDKEMAAYPLGLGEPDDVAGMAALLLSQSGKWITGQTIVLDGGRY